MTTASTAVGVLEFSAYDASLKFVMVVLGAYIDGFWSPWHDMAVVWLRLAQGFLFPIVLCVTDRHHWSALKKTLQRRCTIDIMSLTLLDFRIPIKDDDGSFVYSDGCETLITLFCRPDSLCGVSDIVTRRETGLRTHGVRERARLPCIPSTSTTIALVVHDNPPRSGDFSIVLFRVL
ncbi:hypothetical protein HPB51_003339 [Rhipicephalus microplus]|uniref:Uncharacterized protein n=1 Tax=Rhipicephalus microplus TaxID=6941 RepID=A0A9J6EX92_RHIMP|nr:hypothetical protein HPB51_003339 [Rhipicephalus microplus]